MTRKVVLDFVQPLLARRRLRSIDGEARRNEPSRQSTRMCEHGSRIGNRWLTHNRVSSELIGWSHEGLYGFARVMSADGGQAAINIALR